MEINKNGNEPKQLQIPQEAFKSVACGNCGHRHFKQSYLIVQYPGGLWSAKRISRPIPIMTCEDCGQPYNDKTCTLIESKKKEDDSPKS